MDNERGPLALSLLLTHIHTASALGSPSFPQTAHLTTPRNEGKLFMQNHKGRFKEKAYKTFKMNTHLCCFEYIFKKDKYTTSTSLRPPTMIILFIHLYTFIALPPQGCKCVQYFWVAQFLPPKNTWRQCAGIAHQTQHCGCLQREYICRLPSLSNTTVMIQTIWTNITKGGKQAEDRATADKCKRSSATTECKNTHVSDLQRVFLGVTGWH